MYGLKTANNKHLKIICECFLAIYKSAYAVFEIIN